MQDEARPDHWIAERHPLVDFVSTTAAAEILGVSDQHVRRLVEGDLLLPTFQFGGAGGRRYVNRAAVMQLLANRQRDGYKTPTQAGRRGPLPKEN